MGTASSSTVRYPSSDGQPMSDNTLQFRWIVTLQGNIDAIFQDDPNVFVAGDLLWYPVEGDNKTRVAPDTMVAFGRPKGYRGSYMQWLEGGVPPQVVFEVLSPNNRFREMLNKLHFYEHYGVDEYYVLDPDKLTLDAWIRGEDKFVPVGQTDGFVSPRLGIRFVVQEDCIEIYRSDGSRFLDFSELNRLAQSAQRQAESAQRQAESAQRQAETEHARAERLASRLRALGENPDE